MQAAARLTIPTWGGCLVHHVRRQACHVLPERLLAALLNALSQYRGPVQGQPTIRRVLMENYETETEKLKGGIEALAVMAAASLIGTKPSQVKSNALNSAKFL